MNACDGPILLSIQSLVNRTGGELFVADLAADLHRRDRRVEVYAPRCGPLAAALARRGIAVTNSTDRLTRPSVIHANSAPDCWDLLRRFPDVPVLYTCHNHFSRNTPRHPRIVGYSGVSRVCLQRLRDDGVPDSLIEQESNFCDLDRFVARGPLPLRPSRALVFSNYAKEGGFIASVRDACRRAGISVDVVGSGTKRLVEAPETILAQYDLVFAKARCAIEALAVGCAVIVCDLLGLGPMVTVDRLDELSDMNFGAESQTEAHEPDLVLRQVGRYDPEDAAAVSDLVRKRHAMSNAVDRWESRYARCRGILPADVKAPGLTVGEFRVKARFALSRFKHDVIAPMLPGRLGFSDVRDRRP